MTRWSSSFGREIKQVWGISLNAHVTIVDKIHVWEEQERGVQYRLRHIWSTDKGCTVLQFLYLCAVQVEAHLSYRLRRVVQADYCIPWTRTTGVPRPLLSISLICENSVAKLLLSLIRFYFFPILYNHYLFCSISFHIIKICCTGGVHNFPTTYILFNV